MKTWTADLNISFDLTEKQIQEEEWIKEMFADPDNPTDEEIRAYFSGLIHNYAESNDGSELLANADFDVHDWDDVFPLDN